MDSKRILLWCAILSVAALVAHALDATDHLREWWGYGTVFVMTAAFQFFYGLALFVQPWKYDDEGSVRRSDLKYGRSYYLLGLVLTAFALVFYVVSRTSGLPFLSIQAGAEPVTVLSLIASLVNLPLLFMLVILVRRSGSASQRQS